MSNKRSITLKSVDLLDGTRLDFDRPLHFTAWEEYAGPDIPPCLAWHAESGYMLIRFTPIDAESMAEHVRDVWERRDAVQPWEEPYPLIQWLMLNATKRSAEAPKPPVRDEDRSTYTTRVYSQSLLLREDMPKRGIVQIGTSCFIPVTVGDSTRRDVDAFTSHTGTVVAFTSEQDAWDFLATVPEDS